MDVGGITITEMSDRKKEKYMISYMSIKNPKSQK